MDKVFVLMPIVLANAIIAALSLLIYHKINKDGDTAMARFRLEPEETIKDFKILLYAHGFEALALIMVMVAGTMANSNIVDLGRQLSAVYGIAFTVVFYRWYTRFKK